MAATNVSIPLGTINTMQQAWEYEKEGSFNSTRYN